MERNNKIFSKDCNKENKNNRNNEKKLENRTSIIDIIANHGNDSINFKSTVDGKNGTVISDEEVNYKAHQNRILKQYTNPFHYMGFIELPNSLFYNPNENNIDKN